MKRIWTWLCRQYWLIVVWIFLRIVPNDARKGNRLAIRMGLFHDDMGPKVCLMCGNTEHDRKVMDMIDGQICEEEYKCSSCGHVTGYWAYGFFDN